MAMSKSKTTDQKNWIVAMLLLWLAVMISGLGVVYTTHISRHLVNELEGISFVKASLNDSTAIVKFDASKTDLAQIEKAIEKRGYKVKIDL